jgi:thiol-disulfide isomerase/thioredoxin
VRGDPAHFRDRPRVGIHTADIVALAKKIDQIAAAAAARVENPHSWLDAAAQKLVEQVDIDRAELVGQAGHRYLMIRGDCVAAQSPMTRALIVAPIVLGVVLAGTNLKLIRENEHLGQVAHYYASLRHTPTGVALPDLQGKDPEGRDLTISYKDVNQDTLLFVFSPTCPHCKRVWPVWLDLARAAKGKRVAFVNVGGPIPSNFSQFYGFDSATVMAQTSADTVLKYSLLEFPITILMSPQGRSENVWTGEIAPSEVSGITKILNMGSERARESVR